MVRLATTLHYCISLASMTSLASWIPTSKNHLRLQQKYNQKPEKVKVDVYYETLCPEVRYFIRTQLYPVWEELNHIMEVHWKPYGKAQYWDHQPSGVSFSCQNGPEECIGNMVHACSIKYITDKHKLADYIHCMIEDNYDPKEIGRSCAEIHNVDWTPINNCSSSDEGVQLLVLHGNDTHNLRPKMTFVPHILLNGRHLKSDEALTNFKHILCSDYGDPRPEACIDII